MPAKRDLAGRSEPAQVIVASSRHEKGGLREVVLGGNGLKHCIGRKATHGHDGRGIARESAVGEGINLEYWRAHQDHPQSKNQAPTIRPWPARGGRILA